MPMIDVNDATLNVQVEGRDGGPTVMLSNSLGTTMQMWGAADGGADKTIPGHPL